MRTAFTELVGVPHPIVGFNRSPGVVAAVTNAGGFGVLAASAYTPAELDAQLTWIDEQTGGKPYGVDLLVPEKFAPGDPDNLVASLRAQIPAGHLAFVAGLLDRYGIPDVPGYPEHDEIAASLNPDGAAALLDVAFRHPIRLIANALGPPPAGLVERARKQGVAVAALVGQPKHAVRQIEAGVDLLIAQGTEAGGHTGTIATMVLTPEIVDIAAGRPGAGRGRHRVRPSDGRRPGPRRGRRLVRVGLAVQRGRRRQPGHQGQVPGRHQLGHGALADQDRQARPPAAQRLARGVGAARQPGAAAHATAADAGQRGLAADRRGRPRRATRVRSSSSRSSSARSSAPSSDSGPPARSPARSWPSASADRRSRGPGPAPDRKDCMNQPSLDPRTPVVVGRRTGLRAPREPGYRQRSPVDLAADAAAEALADTGAEPATVAAAIDTVAGVRQFENSASAGRGHPWAVRITTPDPWPAGSARARPARSWKSAAGRPRSTWSTSSPR